MAASFAYLRDLRPYKTGWRIQVKVLHSWRQHPDKGGETFDMVLADERGTKIHASVRKDNILRFANQLPVGEWRFIENFNLTNAIGQFRPTNHAYRFSFLNQTSVIRSDTKSDSNYLNLAKFPDIISGKLKHYQLIDVVGQVINIGEVTTVEVQGKPTKKLELELRDENDERLPCTLWGRFADEVFTRCRDTRDVTTVILIRFAKINSYKDVLSVSTAYDASQVLINPPYPEINQFVSVLPPDGLCLHFLENRPKYQIMIEHDDNGIDFPMKTLAELLDSTEVGKARILITICAIDKDWDWYYFSCKTCNKKVIPVHNLDDVDASIVKKLMFWCDICKTHVKYVIPRFKLHIVVMDTTGEAKCMLLDSVACEVVNTYAAECLDGTWSEIDDPEVLPRAIMNIVGKTYQFVVTVEKQNVWEGLDIVKVAKVLSNKDLVRGDEDYNPDSTFNSTSLTSADQVPMMLTNCHEGSTSSTPSSKRVLAVKVDDLEQSSTTKRLCMDEPDDVIDKGDGEQKAEPKDFPVAAETKVGSKGKGVKIKI